MALEITPETDIQADEYKIEWRKITPRELTDEERHQLIDELLTEIDADERVAHYEMRNKSLTPYMISLGLLACNSLILLLQIFEWIQGRNDSVVGNMKADGQRIYANRVDADVIINGDVTVIAEGDEYCLYIIERDGVITEDTDNEE